MTREKIFLMNDNFSTVQKHENNSTIIAGKFQNRLEFIIAKKIG